MDFSHPIIFVSVTGGKKQANTNSVMSINVKAFLDVIQVDDFVYDNHNTIILC